MAYRKHLLVDYLEDNELWQEFLAVFESVYGDKFDALINNLATLRDVHYVHQPKSSSEIMSFEDYSLFDRKTLIAIAYTLGFSYPNYGDRLFSGEDYLRIIQNLPLYFQQQGTDNFVEFFGFCLNSLFTLKNTWSDDYIEFVEEKQANFKTITNYTGVGHEDGGKWYPTSHVFFEVDALSLNLNPDMFRDFFDYIAPINLVLLATVLKVRADLDANLSMCGVTYIIDSQDDDIPDDIQITGSGTTTIYV